MTVRIGVLAAATGAAGGPGASASPRGNTAPDLSPGAGRLVRDRGKELAITEYNVGATGADRAAALHRDDQWLTSSGKFSDWMLFWVNTKRATGEGHNWQFRDTASIAAWRDITTGQNQT